MAEQIYDRPDRTVAEVLTSLKAAKRALAENLHELVLTRTAKRGKDYEGRLFTQPMMSGYGNHPWTRVSVLGSPQIILAAGLRVLNERSTIRVSEISKQHLRVLGAKLLQLRRDDGVSTGKKLIDTIYPYNKIVFQSSKVQQAMSPFAPHSSSDRDA